MITKGSKKLLLPIGLSAVLSACDIGPDGLGSAFDSAADAYNQTSSSSSSAPVQVSISGVAAKGLVIGGIVNIHPIVDGVLNTNTTLGSGVTDNTGSYNVNVNSYDGNPVVVRVTTSDTTTMRCDLAGGCGDGFDFGSDVPLNDSSFNLDAVVPPISNPTANVNLSVLTDTATSVALDSLSSNTDTSLSNISQLVRNANQSVANRFSISGDITQLPVVDLTNPSALTNVANDVIQYNLLSSSIVESLVNSDNTLSIAQAVNNFATQYTTNNGLADTETEASTTVTLAEILAQAGSIIDAIQTRDTGSLLNLNSLASIIDANQSLAQTGSTTPTNGTPSEGNLDDLAIVKSMVNALRLVGNQADGFDVEQTMVDSVVDGDLDDLLEALSTTMGIIGSAWEAYSDDNTITSYTDPENQVTVSISAGETSTLYSVDTSVVTESLASVTVVLSVMDIASTLSSTETETSTDTTAALNLSLTGTLTSSATTMVIEDGSSVVLSNGSAASSKSTLEESLSLDSFAFDLSTMITDTATGNMFDGTLGLDITNLSSSTDANGGETQTMDSLSVTVGGEFSDSQSNTLSASLAINSTDADFNFAADETTSEYASASFTLVFNTDREGTYADMQVQISGTRNSLDDADLNITVTYGSEILVTEVDSGTELLNLTITNQSGAALTLSEALNGDITGNITLNDVEYASISNDLGFIVISYSDGFNETF